MVNGSVGGREVTDLDALPHDKEPKPGSVVGSVGSCLHAMVFNKRSAFLTANAMMVNWGFRPKEVGKRLASEM